MDGNILEKSLNVVDQSSYEPCMYFFSLIYLTFFILDIPQLVARPTADLGVASLIPAQSYPLIKIDHEIISMVILLPLIQEGLLAHQSRRLRVSL